MNSQTNKGFTLVEMAVVMVIVGLLVGLGSAMIGPMITMNKVRESREVVEADIASVVSWAASNNRLPNGYTEFQTVISRPNDAWGNAAYYFYDPVLTAGNICGRKTTNLTICKTTVCASADRISNIATAVISGGANYNAQTGIIACPTGITGICLGMFEMDTANIDNCSDTTNCPATYGNATFNQTNRPEAYDDIVRWVTLDELRSKIGCQGAQLKILNNELPYGAVPNAYSVTITADGGVPFATSPNTYKWCVSTLPPGFTQTGGIANANCLGLAENAGWAAASAGLTISFPANTTSTGAYQLTVVARDNADNITTSNACNNASPEDNCSQKVFVLTVNP